MTTTQTISRDELEILAFNGETHTERALARMLLAALDSEPVAVPTFEEWCQRTHQNPLGWVREAMKEACDGCRAAMQTEPVTAATVPEDWQLVPKRITVEMECALSRADSYELGWQWALAAAPAAPEQGV